MEYQVCTYSQTYTPSSLAAVNDYLSILHGEIVLIYFWHPDSKIF